jgi:tetratricopeptide (TPR) repeat protein
MSDRQYERGKEIIPPPPRPPYWLNEVEAIDEMGGLDTPLGVVLWRILRSARLWVDGDPERRAELFSPFSPATAERFALAIAAAPELCEPLGVLALLQRAPDLVDRAQLARACHELYEWAQLRSLSRTAMHFAEVAAYAEPDDAGRCNVAGRACRSAGDYIRSLDWFERGFLLAKRGERRALVNTAVRALLGLGRLLQVQGRLREAAGYFVKAVRRSTRRDRRALAADLFALLAELGRYRLALKYARGAVTFYGPKHPRYPYAVHDFAFLLIRRSFFRLALELLDVLPPYFKRPGDLALVWSTQAWAAAATGDHGRYLVAEERTLRVVGLSDEYSAAALIHVAEAARAVGEWDKADRYAHAAGAAARERGNTAIEQEAEDLRGAIQRRERGAVAVDPPRGEVTELVQDYKARLRRWRGPKPGEPGPLPV